ncbi:polysaccharide deactylase family protein, PEP-CTERM locus subfamily [Nitrosococcus halophilus Nc 4]|uniref:Polysaccharide deactylase family protein, PEP-CTERM locus subfamily n=1 Tax=Nitrosococcus halophilus (strain Nc4) TaxID=472759 RepID=D5C043_NITHN|nr:XrtA system polysaccharide deacetylase [Nitrosococcus halophilus]ADE16290.1 polysaccharide deactylase family protein, PEP-CTERM locus subfamily [Nitrosococcus halophilus Nc 4]
MTVDVEDYFHVSAFEKNISRDRWDTLPCRVEQNTDRILQLFADHGICGTFFMLGWVAERYPNLLRRIVNAGHELASHGFSHIRVTQQDMDSFREDVSRTRKLLEDLSGTAVLGYRAASYSIGRENLWAHRVLAETGYRYSSSIYPIHHDLYGMPEAPRFAFHPPELPIFLEIPVSTVAIGRHKFPCGGGGYFRLFPYGLFRWALRRVNYLDGQPCIFYFHPWEIDPDQPRQRGVGMKTRFRHYLNLQRMEQRLLRLLSDFHWDRVDRIFLNQNLANNEK